MESVADGSKSLLVSHGPSILQFCRPVSYTHLGFVAQFNIDNLKSIFKGWMKIVSILLLLISPIILFFIAKTTYHNLFAEYFYDNLLVKVISLGPVSYTHLDVYKRQVWC